MIYPTLYRLRFGIAIIFMPVMLLMLPAIDIASM
jgi:hypothetical protein